MNTTDLNHVALHVSNLEMSMEFYGKKLGLEEIDRPDFDFPGAWYRLGELQELHLIAGRTGAVSSSTRGSHFALGVPDIDDDDLYFPEEG